MADGKTQSDIGITVLWCIAVPLWLFITAVFILNGFLLFVAEMLVGGAVQEMDVQAAFLIQLVLILFIPALCLFVTRWLNRNKPPEADRTDRMFLSVNFYEENK